MKSKLVAITAIITVLLTSTVASAWDVFYDGNTLPDAHELGIYTWSSNVSASPNISVNNGSLHINDRSSTEAVWFSREGSRLPYRSSATIEARVKVLSAQEVNPWDFAVGFGTYIYGGGDAFIGLWTDKIGTRYGGENNMRFYSVDMTQFHTIRVASQGSTPTFNVWLDGNEVFSGVTPLDNLEAVQFGSTQSIGATSDSYWDYVAYSKTFSPVPEPSSILALFGGMTALGGSVLRMHRKTE